MGATKLLLAGPRDLSAETATIEMICDEIGSVSDSLARLREDALGVVDAVMDGRLTCTTAERRLAPMSERLADYTRHLTELIPVLGRVEGAESYRAMVQGRMGDTAACLDFAKRVLRRWPTAARAARADGTVIADAPGTDFKPDPLCARTPREFSQALKEYRAWAGEPSLEEMSHRCGGTPVKSTFSNALNMTGALPRLNMVTAIVTGCGGSVEDMQRFASAWRAINTGRAGEKDTHTTQPRRLHPVGPGDGKRERSS